MTLTTTSRFVFLATMVFTVSIFFVHAEDIPVLTPGGECFVLVPSSTSPKIVSIYTCALPPPPSPPLPPPACAAPPGGMERWWRAEDDTLDSVTRLDANAGRIINPSAPLVAFNYGRGQVGNAFMFGGDTFQFVDLPHFPYNYPTLSDVSGNPPPLSIELWFKSTGYGVLVGQYGKLEPSTGRGAPEGGGVPIVYIDEQGFLRISALGYNLADRTRYPTQIISATPVNDGIWKHLVVVRWEDGLQFAYLDGQDIGNIAPLHAGYSSEYHYALGRGYVEGNWPGFTPGTIWSYYTGLIDEFTVYNSPLDQPLVQKLYASSSTGKCGLCTDNDADSYCRESSLVNPPLPSSKVGWGDCADYLVTVYPGASEVCDGEDNDCNQLIDDAGIFREDGLPLSVCTTTENCGSFGNRCPAGQVCSGGTCTIPAETNCFDGNDNDGNGLIDCLDPQCDNIEGCEFNLERTCNDGIDNDGDGVIDCADADCNNNLACAAPTGTAGDVSRDGRVDSTDVTYLLYVLRAQNEGCGNADARVCDYSSDGLFVCQNGVVYTMASEDDLTHANDICPAGALRGDVSNDGRVDSTDVTYLLYVLRAQNEGCGNADARVCDYSSDGLFVCQNGVVYTMASEDDRTHANDICS